MQRKWIRLLLAVIAVPIVTISGFYMVRAYEAGTAFQPSGSGRDLQVNQVVFSGEEDTTAQKNNEEKEGESELWEKDKTAEDSLSPDLKNSADYLFQTGMANLPDGAENINLAGEEAGSAPAFPDNGNRDFADNGYIYDVTGDRDSADLVMGTGSGQNGGNPGGGTGTGTGSGNGQGNGTPAVTPKPSEPSQIPTPEPQPTVRPADTVKDPEPEKPKLSEDIRYTDVSFSDSTSKQWGSETVKQVVMQAADAGENIFGYLYMGQSINREDIYCALNTYVIVNDATRYTWGKNQLVNYDKKDENGKFKDNGYVDITGVSFDGGNTWNTEFPVTIPIDMDGVDMQIKAAYRYTVGDTWADYPELIEYSPAMSRVYLLNRKLTGDTEVIDTDSIINTTGLSQEAGQKYNLYKEQNYFFNKNADEWLRSVAVPCSVEEYSSEFTPQMQQLQYLFPGWTENGEPVDWSYEVTPGRHILEPMDMIPLPEEYQVELKLYYFSEDYQLDPDTNNYGYMQTLTAYSGDGGDMVIPDGVQAIEITGNPVAVDSVTIPDSTVLCKLDTDMLEVKNSCIVGKKNPVFKTRDGVLMDQKETRILEIPSRIRELEIPDTITEIHMSANNQLRTIDIQAESKEKFPDIALEKLKDCKLIMKEDLVDQFLEDYQEQLPEENRIRVSTSKTSPVTYSVQNGAITKFTNNTGSLRKVLKEGGDAIWLADDIAGIEAGAFQREQGSEIAATMLVMPKNGVNVTLETGCFADSNIALIRCYKQSQALYMKEQLQNIGRTDIRLQTMTEAVSGSGYWYAQDADGTITLISVPEDITCFDGVKDSAGRDIAISAIGDGAFSKCKSLQWVILPESVKKIGYDAFRGCTSLQGILIDSRDEIYLGDRSMENCPSLRFLASNAMTLTSENDYLPEITDENDKSADRQHFFYVLDKSMGPVGYDKYATAFEDTIDHYVLKDLDATGSYKMLYGATGDRAWFALRSGGIVPQKVMLPDTTTIIYKWAMAGTKAPGGAYTVNWEQLNSLNTFRERAFYKSDLSGKITAGNAGSSCYIENAAFAECQGITEVTIRGTIEKLEKEVFQACSSLTKAAFGTMSQTTALYSSVFEGCSSLRDIYLQEVPVGLAFDMYNPYMHTPYRFNTEDWSYEQEEELLRIHVPENAAIAYIKKWRYMMAGYVGTTDTPAYENMWETIQFANMDWDTWQLPDNQLVDALAREELLAAENHLRKILGLATVTEPVDFYPYYVDYGYITLAGAPSDATTVRLDADALELPEGWCLNYVGADTFKNSRNLQTVIFPDNFAGIYSNAFRGVESGQLTLIFEGLTPDMTPPELLGGTEEEPFTFGVDMDKITIIVPEGMEALYYEAWKDYGITIAGYAPEAATAVTVAEGNGSVSDGDAAATVSDGNAATVNSRNAQPDNTQEETVQ